jgi:hypothetical protein
LHVLHLIRMFVNAEHSSVLTDNPSENAMKRPLTIFGCAAAVSCALLVMSPSPDRQAPVSMGLPDDPDAQARMEFMMLRDPATNSIPSDMIRRERQFTATLARNAEAGLLKGNSNRLGVVWTERGPNNVGGRSRVFAADVVHSGTLLAGSVAGGMWKSTDDGASWMPTTTPGQIHSTTCIAQDVRSGHTDTWYVGTGEFRGSTNNNTRWGDLYRGDGIFKSTDNGASWSLLSSTVSGTPQTTDDFDYVWCVATDPTNLTEDEVYAATYNGIYRSSNGGATWSRQLVADSSYNDVAVSSTGVVYAHTHEAGVTRIWRSTDGLNWTNIAPAGFPTVTSRVVIGIAPSNPSIVYLFVYGVSTSPNVSGHQIWKYRYISGDGSGAGGSWVNRGGELPSDINSQASYNMIVHVNPIDTNFVIIGGTNLYRSPNGFYSGNVTTTIGGYPYYPGLNHHPDIHSGMFKPGNPSVYYSGHDGGLSRTDNVNASSVEWTSLNNGYNVTQFYSVSLSPDSGSDWILGGSQDNGTVVGYQPGLSSWDMAYGGDGTIVIVAPEADNRLYTQYQGGQMQRMGRDGITVVDVTPSGATNMMFVNPIALDPNNTSILYYGGGRTSPAMTSGLWRNDNIINASATAGWTAIAATDVGAAAGYLRTVSCISVSKANPANTVYYGTIDGIVKRVDAANTATPIVTDVTPPGLNGGTAAGGFVRCVAVDPANGMNALVVFGNYNFQSLWYTTNGGASWTDVEGNLAGPSGPSVRFAEIFYVGNTNAIFLGSSIGLLSTTTLNGSSTVWTPEAQSEIGNVIVAWLDYRPADRILAVGTHARGIWTGQFDNPNSVAQQSVPVEFALDQNYPNPFNPASTIHFTLGQSGKTSARVFDIQGRLVTTLVDGVLAAGKHSYAFNALGLSSGVYFLTLTSGQHSATRKMILMR